MPSEHKDVKRIQAMLQDEWDAYRRRWHPWPATTSERRKAVAERLDLDRRELANCGDAVPRYRKRVEARIIASEQWLEKNR